MLNRKSLAAPASIVHLVGDFDLSRREELAQILSTAYGSRAVVIDLSAVRYMDSTALGCLVALKKRLLENDTGATVALAGANATLTRVFEICEFGRLFDIYESVPGGYFAASDGSSSML